MSNNIELIYSIKLVNVMETAINANILEKIIIGILLKLLKAKQKVKE